MLVLQRCRFHDLVQCCNAETVPREDRRYIPNCDYIDFLFIPFAPDRASATEVSNNVDARVCDTTTALKCLQKRINLFRSQSPNRLERLIIAMRLSRRFEPGSCSIVTRIPKICSLVDLRYLSSPRIDEFQSSTTCILGGALASWVLST